MNVHTNPRASTMSQTPEEIVVKIADKFASAEKHLRLAAAALNGMPALYAQIHEAKSIGYLESLQRSGVAQVNAGLVATAALAVANAHISDTTRAQELGIDLPSVRSGGGR